jgi:leucyl aminopeptidase
MGQVQIDGLDAEGRLIVSSSMQLTEYRLDQRQLAARVFYKLESGDDGCWRMHLKRVNLVNLDAIFANLEVFL